MPRFCIAHAVLAALWIGLGVGDPCPRAAFAQTGLSAAYVSEEPPIVEVRLPPDAGFRAVGVRGIQQEPVWRDQRRVARFRLPGPAVGSLDVVLRRDGEVPETVTVPVGSRWNESPPDWAMGAVWYNVFPERFDNADPGNDPCEFWSTTRSWDQAWFDVTVEEVERAWMRSSANPERYPRSRAGSGGAYATTVFQRRYGGDLQGLVRRLDHIKELGCDAIWLCPVFASPSLHKYDTSDHRHIDPAFGPAPDGCDSPVGSDEGDGWGWTPADRYFVDVVLPECKKRGIRVILDGVWNHVGLTHFAFRDVRKHGRGSRYADWFDAEFDDRFEALGALESWSGWGGRKDGNLPEFRQIGGDLAPGVKRHIFDVTSRWMDPNGDGDPSDGIDGWRLDVANEVGRAFWKDWRAHVRQINPEALIIGELWFDGREYFDGTAFDAQMNYPFAFAVTGWLGRERGVDAADLASRIEATLSHRTGTDLAMMNLLGSHDTPRFVTMIENPGFEYDRGGGIGSWQNEDEYARGRPDPRWYDMSLLGVALQVALPGSPMVYAGDELGMFGADDPENRKPLPWPDVPHDPSEAMLEDVLDRYRSWFGLRSDPGLRDVLRFGTTEFVEHPDPAVLVLDRRLDGERVRFVLNPTSSEVAGGFPNAGSPGVGARAAGVWVGRGEGGAWKRIR